MTEWKRRAGNVDPFSPPESDSVSLDQRAERAASALRAYAKEGGEEELEEHHLRDLLCDLQHYCDKHGIDFNLELRRGSRFYEEEINE